MSAPSGSRRAVRDRGLDLRARGKAGIEQPHGLELCGGGAIGDKALRLEDDGLLPGNPKPGKVGEDAGDERRPRAALVDVLDAQQKPATAGARHPVVDQGRERMAQMQFPVGAWCEAQDGTVHGDGSAIVATTMDAADDCGRAGQVACSRP